MTPQSFVKRWLTLSDVNGRPLPEAEIIGVVGRYSTLAWMMMLARIDRCLLFRQVDLAAQCRIAEALLGVKGERVIREITRKDAIAFHDHQLRYALRLALLHGRPDNTPELNSTAALQDVAVVLLGINDHLVDPESADLREGLKDRASQRAFMNVSLRAGEAFQRTLTARSMVREYELLISIPRQLDSAAALALEKELLEKLDVDLPTTVALGFAILTHSFGHDPFEGDVPLAIRNPLSWFEGLGIPEPVKLKFLGFMIQDVVHARANAKAATRMAELYDYEWLEKWPIIRTTDDTIVVTTIELLFRRTTSGMYGLLMHLAKKKGLADLRERIQRRRAVAYEAIIRAGFDTNSADVELLARRTYHDANGNDVEAGDAVVVDHARRRVVVFEAKSGHIDRRDRLMGSVDDLFQGDGTLPDALTTLARLVRDIRDGLFDVGIPHSRIERIAPVIVSADEFFQTPIFRTRLIREADNKFLRATSQVAPVCVASLDAVDTVRIKAMSPRDFVNALFAWQSDREWSGTTLSNYLRVKLKVEDPAETVQVGLHKLLFERIVPDLKLPASPPADPPSAALPTR